MAAQDNTILTLADYARRKEYGKQAVIAEMLDQENAALRDIPFVEANGFTEHQSTQRTGLPAGYYRKINQGWAAEKSTTAQVRDTMAMFRGRSKVDEDLAALNGESKAFLMSENRAFIEGMAQTQATTLFYGDTSLDQEQFHGLAPRFNDLAAGNARNIVTGDGAANDNTSIWLINWGADRVHGIYPKGSKFGLNSRYKGVETVLDPDGLEYEAHVTLFMWDMGVCLRDWRYVVRGCNIDVSNLTYDAATGTDLVLMIKKMLHRIRSTQGTPVFYMHGDLFEYLDAQATNSTNVNISRKEVFGEEVKTINGIPVREHEGISLTEATVA